MKIVHNLPNKLHYSILVFLFLSTLISHSHPVWSQTQSRPNVVIIYADDMGFSDVSAYGQLYNISSPAFTPNMDALAKEGMMFTNAHSASAICTPSRYSLLTGKFHWRTLTGIGLAFGRPEIPNGDITLAEYMKSQGYDAAAFGKWHLGGYFYSRQGTRYNERNNHITDQHDINWERRVDGHAVDHGFDIFKGLAVTINVAPYVYLDGARIQYYDTSINDYRDAKNSDTFHYFTRSELNDSLTVGTDSRPGLGDPSYKQIEAGPRMIQQVEQYFADRTSHTHPFFVYVSLYSPHKPWHITTPFKNSEGFAYGDFMREVDDRIRRVIQAIDHNGFKDNTIVILTSDNGPETTAFTNSRSNGRDPNGPFRGVKRDGWEGGTRVPFIVRWPNVVPAGEISDQLIWHGDIFQTIADYHGFTLPHHVAPDGVSFLPILDNTATSIERDAIVTASSANQHSLKTTDGWKLIDGTGGGGNGTSYSADNTNIMNARGNIGGSPKQLFYLPNDPGEINNLQDTHPHQLNVLLQALDNIRANKPGFLPSTSPDLILDVNDSAIVSAALPADDGGIAGQYVIRERKVSDYQYNRHISGFFKFDLSQISDFYSHLGDQAYLSANLTSRLNTRWPSNIYVGQITGGNWDGHSKLPPYSWATISPAPLGPGSQINQSILVRDVRTAKLGQKYQTDITTIVDNWLNNGAANYGLGMYLSDHYQGAGLDNVELLIFQDTQRIKFTPSDQITIPAAEPADPGLNGNFVLLERRQNASQYERHITGFVQFDLSSLDEFKPAAGHTAQLSLRLLKRLNTSQPSNLYVAKITGGPWNSTTHLPEYQWATLSDTPIGPGSQTRLKQIVQDIRTTKLNERFTIDISDIVDAWVNHGQTNYGLGLLLDNNWQGVSIDQLELIISK